LVSTNLLCLSSGSVYCVSFKPDNPNIVVSSSYDKTIKTWDITSGSCLSTLKVDSSVYSVAYSPDGTKLAAGLGSPSRSVLIFDTQTNEQLCQLRGHRYAPSPSRECFLFFVSTNLVYLSSNWVRCVAFKPDNPNILVSGSNDKTIIIWDITSGSCLSTLTGHSNWVTSVSWSPDGKRLASGSYDKTVRIWDSASGEQLCSLNVGYAFSRCSTRISLPARPLFSRFSTRISV